MLLVTQEASLECVLTLGLVSAGVLLLWSCESPFFESSVILWYFNSRYCKVLDFSIFTGLLYTLAELKLTLVSLVGLTLFLCSSFTLFSGLFVKSLCCLVWRVVLLLQIKMDCGSDSRDSLVAALVKSRQRLNELYCFY